MVSNEKNLTLLSVISKAKIRYGLGILWIIDALLQLQPGMFTKAYYGNLPSSVMPSVLQDLHDGAPGWIAWAVAMTQWLFIHWPIETNLFIVLIQLLLGLLLIFRVSYKYARMAAWGSIIWGCVIWVFGEALGGLGSWGDMTFYQGFPGSALIYAFAGAVLLLADGKWTTGHTQYLISRFMAVFFAVCGLLQLLPINGQWPVASQMSIFGNSGFQTQSHFMSDPVMAYTMWISNHATLNNWILSICPFLSAICVWFWREFKAGHWFVYVWLFWSWWFGMDFGYLFSGLSTDLNTSPMCFVLLWAIAPSRRRGEVSSRVIAPAKLV